MNHWQFSLEINLQELSVNGDDSEDLFVVSDVSSPAVGLGEITFGADIEPNCFHKQYIFNVLNTNFRPNTTS